MKERPALVDLKARSFAPGVFSLALFPFSGINVKMVFLLLWGVGFYV